MPVTAAELEHLIDRAEPVATVLVQAPAASEDSDERRGLRAKELRSELDESSLPDEVVGRVETILSRGAASGWQPQEWLAVVADPGEISVVPLIDGRDELASVGSLPRFVPFVRDQFEHRRHLVVRCDRTGASVARVTRGKVQRDRVVEGDEQHVQKVQSGGWAQRNWQNHTEHTWDRNAQEIADVVAAEAEAIDADLVVVTGDERAVGLVQHHIPERWQDVLVLDTLQPTDQASENEVFERAETLVRDQAATELVELLGRYAEARGRGEAADGTDAVFDALRLGQVDVLLVADDVDDEAYFAAGDPRQVATDAPTLTEMGFEDIRSGRLTDVAVRAAFSGDSGVVVCPSHGPDSPKGPLGALLRF